MLSLPLISENIQKISKYLKLIPLIRLVIGPSDFRHIVASLLPDYRQIAARLLPDFRQISRQFCHQIILWTGLLYLILRSSYIICYLF